MTDSPPGAGALSPADIDPQSASDGDGGRSEALTVAGIWFVTAGLGLVAPWFAALLPNRFQGLGSGYISAAPMLLGGILSSAAVLVGSVAGFVVLTRAGFPRRSRAVAFVTIGLAVAFPLQFLARFGYLFGELLWTAADVIALIIGALLLAFAISAARNRVLPLGFRIVPVVQFVLAMVGYAVGFRTSFPVSGVAFIGVGVAYIVLAAHARASLEAAAVATADERRGRPSPHTSSPDPAQ